MFARAVPLACLAVAATSVASGTTAFAADRDAWLAHGMPPLIEPDQEPPYRITSLTIERNEIDQQVVRGTVERDRAIRAIPEAVRIVVLPVGGGRYADRIELDVTGPQEAGRFNVVGGRLLDWRGELPGGARAYLEMKIASTAANVPPVRISAPFWYGTDEQLAEAMESDEPPAVDPQSPASIELVEAPADMALPKGTPAYVSVGERQAPAVVWNDAEPKQAPTMLAYFARPGGEYTAYRMTVPRERIRIEPSALQAAKSKDDAISENYRRYEERLSKLSKEDAPKELRSASEADVAEGDRLVGFTFLGMEPFEAMSEPIDGFVMVRPLREGDPIERPVDDLYIEPSPNADANAEPGTTAAGASSPSSEKPQVVDPQAVAENYPIEKGDKFQARWGGRWFPVEVVEVQPEGVKIHWIGYRRSWDRVIPRTELYELIDTPPAD